MHAQEPEQDHALLIRALDEAVSKRQVRVPPYPSTAMRLQSVLQREDYRVDDLVQAMKVDQAFTGNVLRLANSPLYRRGSEVTSMANAVMRVGAKELTRLAMAAAISHATSGGQLQKLRRRVWRESLASAVVSERLAPGLGVEPGEAFVAGLLHDVGKVLALTVIEEVCVRHPALAEQEAVCWAEVERTHVAFGSMVAERWQLPGVLGAVIAMHHDSFEQHGPLVSLVLRGDAAVSVLERQSVVSAEALVGSGLTLDEAVLVERLAPSIPAFLSALDTVEPPSVKVVKPSTVTAPMSVEVAGGTWAVRRASVEQVEVESSAVGELGALVEVTLRPANVSFWAVVEQRAASDDATVLRPFALSAPAAAAWPAMGPARAA